MTGFAKALPKGTKTETHFDQTYTDVKVSNGSYLAMDGQICFHRKFTTSNTAGCTTGLLLLLRSDTKLRTSKLPSTFLSHSVDCVSLCHILNA